MGVLTLLFIPKRFILTDLCIFFCANFQTALDVFVELEKVGLLSQSDLQELRSILMEVNRQLASTVEQFAQGTDWAFFLNDRSSLQYPY